MAHHFAKSLPATGAGLPRSVFGRLVGQFRFASHIPLRGGQNTGRHLYLALNVPSGPNPGLYEAAVNIRSDEGTEVLFTERIENVAAANLPAPGFQGGVKLAYGTGPSTSDTTFLGLSDADFQPIENDSLYDRLSGLTQGCAAVAVYGVTYSSGDGIHDVHMNSGTAQGDAHAADDRVHEDGAIAFYFNLDQQQAFAHWVFIKFSSQRVVNG
jgi:hypothetical protein